MNARVFAVDLIRKPSYESIWIFRTNGRADGARLRQYRLTSDRLILVLRAMMRTAATRQTRIRTTDGHDSWSIPIVVEEQDAARAALGPC
jgi:hypothetical protein